MRNAKSIIILLTIIAVAAALDYFVYFGKGPSSTSKRTTLVDFQSEAASVRIERVGSPAVVLDHGLGGWRLTDPFASGADEQAVMKLVDVLTQTPVVEVISDSELLKLGRTRADFSLEEPVLTVTLTGMDKSVCRFMFGSATPTQDGVYASVEGVDAVFILGKPAFSFVDVRPDDLRQRSLLPLGGAWVTSFEIKREGIPLLEFLRTGAGWNVGSEKASSQKITEFIDDLTTASAVSFIWPVGSSNETDHVTSSLLAGYGLDPDSAVTVTLNDINGKSRRLSFGKEADDGNVYALVQNGNAIVTVPSKLRDFARQDPVMFTDSRLFPVEARSVNGFSVSSDGSLYSLVRDKDGKWGLESPVVAPADQEASDALLSLILSLSPADVVKENGVAVSVLTNMSKVLIPRERILGKRTFEDLRSREMLKIDAPLVKRIVSTVGGKTPKTASVVYDRERRQWNLDTEADGVAVNVKGVESVLSVLNPLAAVRIEKLAVVAADLDDYGLDTPFLTVAIDQDSDETIRRNILIGKKTRGGRFATIGSSDAIFVISDATVSRLSASIVGK